MSSAGAAPGSDEALAGQGGNPDAAVGGGSAAGTSAEVVAPRSCAVGEPFGMPSRVLGITDNAGSYDGKPWLSPDERTVYFVSSRQTDREAFTVSRLWMATRPSRNEMFAPATLVDLPSQADDAALTGDGQTMILSLRGGLSVLTREPDRSFSAVLPLPGVPGASPWVPQVGNHVYLVRKTDEGIGLALWDRNASPTQPRVTLPMTGVELGLDCGLTLSQDEREVFVAAPGKVGGSDIFVASRPDAASAFGPAHPLAELNTEHDDSPAWLSADSCRLYFERSGPDSGIFVASRPIPCGKGPAPAGCAPFGECDQGACVEGYCGTETVLDADIGAVAIDDRFVYAALEESTGIVRAALPPMASDETTLAADTGYVWRLVRAGDDIVFSTLADRVYGASRIEAVARDGGTPRVLATAIVDAPPVGADGGFVYWLEPAVPCALMRVSQQGGPSEVFTTFDQACEAELFIGLDSMLKGNDAFVVEGGRLRAVRLKDGQVRKVGPISGLANLAMDHEYPIASDGRTIFEFDDAGRSQVAMTSRGSNGLAFNSPTLFWGEADAVRFLGLGRNETGSIGAGPPPVEVVGSDDSFVYYTDSGGTDGKRLRRTRTR